MGADATAAGRFELLSIGLNFFENISDRINFLYRGMDMMMEEVQPPASLSGGIRQFVHAIGIFPGTLIYQELPEGAGWLFLHDNGKISKILLHVLKALIDRAYGSILRGDVLMNVGGDRLAEGVHLRIVTDFDKYRLFR